MIETVNADDPHRRHDTRRENDRRMFQVIARTLTLGVITGLVVAAVVITLTVSTMQRETYRQAKYDQMQDSLTALIKTMSRLGERIELLEATVEEHLDKPMHDGAVVRFTTAQDKLHHLEERIARLEKE